MLMGRSFHNSIEAKGQLLIDLEVKTKAQEERVLEIFQLNRYRSLSNHETYTIYLVKYESQNTGERKTPFDSIKRSVTNLTAEDKLIKNPKSEQVPGPYGVPVYTWRFNNNPKKQLATINQQTQLL